MRPVRLHKTLSCLKRYTHMRAERLAKKLGIGCLSRMALREALRRGSLVEVQTPQFDLRRRFYIARHRQRHLSAAAGRLLELCRALSSATPDTRGLQLPYIP